MKYAITTILAAALASAAVVPAATVDTAATALPANFKLKFTTPVAKSPLKAYEGIVTIDNYIGRILNLGPGSNQVQIPVTFVGKAGVATMADTEFNTIRTLSVNADGYTVLWYDEFSGPPTSTTTQSGFTQFNGLLALDLHDGKGAQSLWKACPDQFFSKLWNVSWGVASGSCTAIDLHIVAI